MPFEAFTALAILRRKSEEWRYLVDSFSNGKIKYTFTLHHIQTVFSVLKIEIANL